MNLNSLIFDIDTHCRQVSKKYWVIKWRGNNIIAGGRASWKSNAAARAAFHREFGSFFSKAILNAGGTYFEFGYVATDTTLKERNRIIEHFESVGILEFVKQ